MSRFERHMKQEHEMYSNHGELLLSVHFLTGAVTKIPHRWDNNIFTGVAQPSLSCDKTMT